MPSVSSPLPTKTVRSKSDSGSPFFAEVESALDAGKGIALMGPRGTGKTTTVRKLAMSRNKPLIIIPVHADMQIEEVRGETVLRDGCSFFQPGPLVTAAKDGGWVLLDEVNLGRPGLTAWLNPILDDDGIVSIPQTGEQFAVHPEFRAFLCFNIGYHGTRALNEALLDRCRVIHFCYWPAREEIAVLRQRLPRLSDVDLERMVKVANGIRTARRKGTVDFDFSIRTLFQWGFDADQRTQDLLESFTSVVLPKVGDPDECAPPYMALTEIAKLVLK